MAISPQALNETFKKDADKFEELIDNVLQKKSLSTNGTVIVPAPDGMTLTHFEILKPKYIAVGWKSLKWDSYYDQRDREGYTSITFNS
jgi:hypothetical protein